MAEINTVLALLVVPNPENALATAVGEVVTRDGTLPEDALMELGGTGATNPLAGAVAAMAKDVTASLSAEALAALGGDAAVTDLAQAVLDLTVPNNSYKRPGDPNNLTNLWFRKHWARVRPGILEGLRRAFPTSQRAGVIDDFLGDWITKILAKDHLAPFLAMGEEVKPSVLQFWAIQAATSSIRAMGVDALTRTLYGAQTVRERAGTVTNKQTGTPMKAAYARSDRESGSKKPTLRDFFDPSTMNPEEALSRSQRLDHIRAMLRRGRTQDDGQRYVAVFNSMISGDVSLVPEGLSESKVVSMVATIKRTIGLRPRTREAHA